MSLLEYEIRLFTITLFLIDRHPCLLNLTIDAGAGVDMGNVKEINIFTNSFLDIVQETDKVKPTQAAVHQQVDVAVLCRGSFAVGTKQDRFPNGIRIKDRGQDCLQLR